MIPLIKNNGNKKTILLVGETGAGKSSVGNLILGREEFIVSDEVDSCTMTTVKKTSSIDPSIEVIDTPGLIDTQGRDKIHNEQMIEYIKSLNENDKNNLNFVLVVFNFSCKRLNESMQNMIKFLCNVFPINFAHHIGIVFTRYDHNKEMKKKNKKNMNAKQVAQQIFVPRIMEIISITTNEKLFLDPPIFFVDCNDEDDVNTQEELKRLIAFTKTLPPIEIIRRCNSKYKEVIDIFETETHEENEGNRILVIERKYKKKQFIDYSGNVTYSDRKLYSEIQTYKEKMLPKLEEKEMGNFLKDAFETGFNLYQGMKFANDINKKENYSLNGWDKALYAVIGAGISQNTLRNQRMNSQDNNK